jgi:hypothetical protein
LSRAIGVAAGLRRAMTQADAESMTWVPVPPSKVAAHADYDDRLMRTLAKAFGGFDVDVRSLLRQSMMFASTRGVTASAATT